MQQHQRLCRLFISRPGVEEEEGEAEDGQLTAAVTPEARAAVGEGEVVVGEAAGVWETPVRRGLLVQPECNRAKQSRCSRTARSLEHLLKTSSM